VKYFGGRSCRCDESRILPPFADRFCYAAFFLKGAFLKPYLHVILLALAWSAPSFAQKLVDPSTVAPEYREAAEKRRAEQIRQRDCAKKADIQKVIPRDRTAFLLECLKAAEAAEASKAAEAANGAAATK
jgi:hypothetical protein